MLSNFQGLLFSDILFKDSIKSSFPIPNDFIVKKGSWFLDTMGYCIYCNFPWRGKRAYEKYQETKKRKVNLLWISSGKELFCIVLWKPLIKIQETPHFHVNTGITIQMTLSNGFFSKLDFLKIAQKTGRGLRFGQDPTFYTSFTYETFNSV